MEKITLTEHRPQQKAEKLDIDNIDDLFLNSRFSYPFVRLRELLRSFETYTIFPNTLRQPQRPSNQEYLSSHGDNLTSVLKRMRSQNRREAISQVLDAMRLVVPTLDNIAVQSVGGFMTPQFRMRGVTGDERTHVFSVNQMSDGTLRILGILLALYQDPGPSVIALEEPELTVHPGVLQLVSDAIIEVSQSSQILVTTHSPELIEHFDPTNIIAVELEQEVTTARRLRSTQVDAVKSKLFTLGELMTVEGLHG